MAGADNADRQLDFTRGGRKADLIRATLKTKARAELRHARLIVDRNGDVEAHHGATLINRELVFREFEAAPGGARKADRLIWMRSGASILSVVGCDLPSGLLALT